MTQSNILFIVLPHIIRETDAKNPRTRSYKAFPIGVLSIVTYIHKYSHKNITSKIIDCNIYSKHEYEILIKDTLKELKPEIVCLSMNYDNSYKHLLYISKLIKTYNKEFNNEYNKDINITVLGGSSASFSYKEILDEQPFIDGICYTEGEIPVTHLIDILPENRLHFLNENKSWITKESIKKGQKPERNFVNNLDNVIDIDYSLISDMSKYRMSEAFSPFLKSKKGNIENDKKQFFIITSRGCPYKCVFCATCSGIYSNTIRYANVDKIISHVEFLVNKYNMNILTIYDDQLLMNKERAKELFKKLAKFNLRIECPNGLSAAFIDDELAYLMKNAGMDTIILAIEHGSEYILKYIVNKPLSLKMVKPTVDILRKYNFFIESFFVIGLPGEEDKHRKECMKFIKEINFDWCGFNLATPLRGSRLYDICIKNGYINKNLKINEIQDKRYIIYDPPHLTPEKITTETYLMNLDVNFVNNYRMKTGDYEIAAKCFEDVISRTTNHAFAYYYLAEALSKQNKVPLSIINNNKRKFDEIISKDNTWKKYAEHFNII